MVTLKGRKLLALLLALMMVFAVSGCKKAPEEVSEPEESQGFINTLPLPNGAGWKPAELEKFSQMAQEKYKLNQDTVGWLHLPGTTINDVIVWRGKDPTTGQPDYNQYYLRRDFEGRYSFEGIYFADFRSKFDSKKRDSLVQNTIIYGHSMEDDPNGAIFSQLKKYLDPDFAKAHPYINFSTLEDDMVWEVFAVFYSSTSFFYNTPAFDNAAHFESIIGDSIKRSIYTYDVPVTPEDKILTLSTCCYNIVASYPNNYRYVVMAKLVDENSKLKEEAVFTKNPEPKAP